MTAEALFPVCNYTAMAGWLLLIFAPRTRWAASAATRVIPLLLALLYVALLASHWSETRGGFSSLQSVADLFSNRWLLLAGWVHYLAFDLFVGAWEVRDAVERGIPHRLAVPCLLLTFLFGPAGLLCYMAVRGMRMFRPTAVRAAAAAARS